MADLLETYVKRVGHFLPKARREALTRELRSSLIEMVRERSLIEGGDHDAIVAQVVQEAGAPEEVALRHRSGRSFVGPLLVAEHAAAVRIALYLLVIPFVLALCVQIVQAGSIGAAVAAGVRTILQYIQAALAVYGAIALAFHAAERAGRTPRGRKAKEWDAAAFAKIDPNDLFPPASVAAAIAANAVVILLAVFGPGWLALSGWTSDAWGVIPLLKVGVAALAPWIAGLCLLQVAHGLALLQAGVWTRDLRRARLVLRLLWMALLTGIALSDFAGASPGGIGPALGLGVRIAAAVGLVVVAGATTLSAVRQSRPRGSVPG